MSDFIAAALHHCSRAAGWPLRLCWQALRWALLLLALLWGLAVVAWSVLHWGILPHANEWRPWLEKEASKALGVELRIGRVTVESGGWMPRMELGEVRVLDSAGRVALQLPRVSAVLSAHSLLVLQPRFSQLLVDAPELTIRRDAQGRIFIAGLGLDAAEQADAGTTEAGLDWLFSQPELAVVHGRVRWVDEQRADTRPLVLSDLNFVMRNGLRRHDLRLDATPPADWGQRFTLRGRFVQSLLKRPGELRHWSGQLYADLPQADLSQLRRHVDLPFKLSEGDGAVRAWAEIRDGQPAAATLDLALRSVRLKLLDQAPELDLDHIQGRLDLARSKGALSLQAHQLGFVSRDHNGSGIVWPRSDWGVTLRLGKDEQVLGGEVNAQRLDFALMAQIAQRLPLGARAHQLLAELAPRGVLTALSGQWQGALDAPQSYHVKAELSGLALAARPAAADDHLGRPGLRGASLSLDANERGGQARLAMQDGQVELPGLFEDPVLPVTRLSTQLSWKLPQAGGKTPDEVELRLRDLRVQTPDLSGEFDVLWKRAAGATTPGYIDLSGKVPRVDATRVARYVPLSLPATRHYLAGALRAGQARATSVRLKGELHDFPFDQPRSPGIFRVATQAQGVQLAYVPHSDTAPGWPVLEGVDAGLVFERAGMQIRDGRATVLGYELGGVNGGIQDFHHGSTLVLDGTGRGAGADLLRFVRNSPLDEWLGHALSATTAQGPVGLRLGLNIPLEHTEQSTVKGQLQFSGVDLKLRPDLPPLSSVRGRVDFDRKGLQLGGVTARLLGGDATLDGGSQRDGGLRFAVQGLATADGLRHAPELGAVARLAQAASGHAAYRFQLAVNKDGQSELSVASSLQGLAIDLPAPAHKDAEAALPLRLLMTPTAAGRDELRLEVGAAAAPLLQAQLQRDVSGTAGAQVLRGAIAVQDKLPQMPASGVLLQVNAAALDLDAWQQRVGALAGGQAGSAGDGAGLLPSQIALRSQALKVNGRQLGRVDAQVARDGANWRLTLDADHLAGRIELRNVRGSRVDAVQARLTRLSLPRAEADRVSALMDPAKAAANASPLPSLDIVVDDFELASRRLGRLEVQAQAPAAARDWQLDKLQITSPDATLTAQGRWGGEADGHRRTQLDWTLDIADAGRLMERMGQGQVLRGGRGQLAGQIGWDGSPLAPHYPSMAGAMHVQLDTGTFLKVEPGVGRLLGILSLQSLPRRLLLDFRDVFAEGFTFDGVTGDVNIAAGVARSDNIRIRGLQATVLVDGSTDLAAETQKLRVVVVPEVSAGGASLAYAAINPAVALGAFLAQMILSRPMAAANTREFHITGSWNEPKVEKVENPAAASAASPASAPAGGR